MSSVIMQFQLPHLAWSGLICHTSTHFSHTLMPRTAMTLPKLLHCNWDSVGGGVSALVPQFRHVYLSQDFLGRPAVPVFNPMSKMSQRLPGTIGTSQELLALALDCHSPCRVAI